MYTEDTVHYYHLSISTIRVLEGALPYQPQDEGRQPHFIVFCVREPSSPNPGDGPSRLLAVSNPIRLRQSPTSAATEGGDDRAYAGRMVPPLTHCQAAPFDLPSNPHHEGGNTSGGRGGATQVDLTAYLLPNVTGASSMAAYLQGAMEDSSSLIQNIPGASEEALTLTKVIECGLLKVVGSCTVDLGQFLGGQTNVDHEVELYASGSDSADPCCFVRVAVDVFANGSGIGFQIRSRQAQDMDLAEGGAVAEFEAIDDHYSTIPVVSCSVSYQPTKGSAEERISASEADRLHPIPAPFVPKVVFNAADRWATNTLPTSLRRVLYDPFVPLTDDIYHQPQYHNDGLHMGVMQATSALQPPAPHHKYGHHHQTTSRSQGVVPPFSRTTPFFPLVVGSSQAVFRDFPHQKMTAAVLGGPLAAYELRHPMDDITATVPSMQPADTPWWQRNYANLIATTASQSFSSSVPSGPRVPVASVSVTFADIHRWVMLPSGSTTCEPGVGVVTVLDVTSTIAPSTGLPAREIRIDMRASPDPPQPQHTDDHSGAVHLPNTNVPSYGGGRRDALHQHQCLPPPPPGPSELYDGVFTLVLYIHNMQDWLCLMGGRPLPQIGSNNGLRLEQDANHKKRLTSPGSAEVEHVPWSVVLRGKRGRRHAKERTRALEALHSAARRRPFCSWTQQMEGKRLLAGDTTGMLLNALSSTPPTDDASVWYGGDAGRTYLGQMMQTLVRWSGSPPVVHCGGSAAEPHSGFNPPRSTVRSAAALRAHFEHLMSQKAQRDQDSQLRTPSKSLTHYESSPPSTHHQRDPALQYHRPPNGYPHQDVSSATVTSSPSRTIHHTAPSARGRPSSPYDPLSQIGAGRRPDSSYRYYNNDAPSVLGSDMAAGSRSRYNEALREGLSHTTGSDLLNRRSRHQVVPYNTPDDLSMQPVLPSTLWDSTSQGTASYWKSPQSGVHHRDEQHTVLCSPPRPPYTTERTSHSHQSMLVRDLPHPEDAYRTDLTRRMYTPHGAHAAAVEGIRNAQLIEQGILAETHLHRRRMSNIYSQPTTNAMSAAPSHVHHWDNPRSLLANNSPLGSIQHGGGAFYPVRTPKAVAGALPDSHIPLNPSDVLYVMCLQGGPSSLGAVAPYYYSCMYDTAYRVADTSSSSHSPYIPLHSHYPKRTPRFAEAITAGSLVSLLVPRRHDEVLPGRGGFAAGGCDRLEGGVVAGPLTPAARCVASLRNNSFIYWHIVSVEVDALVGALCGMDPVPSYTHYHTQWTPQHVIVRWVILLLWVAWSLLLPSWWVVWVTSLMCMSSIVGYGILVVVVGPRKMAPPRTAAAIPGMHRNNPRAMSQGFSAWEWLVLRPLGLLPDAPPPTQSPQRRRTPGDGLRSPSPTSAPSPYSHYVTGASRTMGGADDGCGGNSAAVPVILSDGGLGMVATVGSAVQSSWRAVHATAAAIAGPFGVWVSGLTATMPPTHHHHHDDSDSEDDDEDERLWTGHALMRRFMGEDDALHTTLHGGSSRHQLDSYRYSSLEKIARYDLCETSLLVSLHTRLAARRMHAVSSDSDGALLPNVGYAPHHPLPSHTGTLLTSQAAVGHRRVEYPIPGATRLPITSSHPDYERTLRLGEFMLSPVLRHVVTSALKEGGRTHAAAGLSTLSSTLHLRWSRFFSYGQCAPLWAAIVATVLTVVIMLRIYFFWIIPVVFWFGPLVGRALDSVVYTLCIAYIIYPDTLPARWGRALLYTFLSSETLSS